VDIATGGRGIKQDKGISLKALVDCPRQTKKKITCIISFWWGWKRCCKGGAYYNREGRTHQPVAGGLCF